MHLRETEITGAGRAAGNPITQLRKLRLGEANKFILFKESRLRYE